MALLRCLYEPGMFSPSSAAVWVLNSFYALPGWHCWIPGLFDSLCLPASLMYCLGSSAAYFFLWLGEWSLPTSSWGNAISLQTQWLIIIYTMAQLRSKPAGTFSTCLPHVFWSSTRGHHQVLQQSSSRLGDLNLYPTPAYSAKAIRLWGVGRAAVRLRARQLFLFRSCLELISASFEPASGRAVGLWTPPT